ncbi:NAD-dependent epimerase/dehydratase family protein [Polaromonas sp.]|uniref:NAD-dependent epimerase/dehydratase family protein n=1 Tax=Polaromonas sp. TaxID=1869339 RepID=UPI003BB714F8
MKVLVLGGSGHIGNRLLEILASNFFPDVPTGATRAPVRSGSKGIDWIRLDTCDLADLTLALRRFDAVVNCVAGDAHSISAGAQVLVQAALSAGCPRIIHLSTMSVYGPVEGTVGEDAPLNPGLGWYGRAKCEAEQHISEFVHEGGHAVILRPGCVFGPGSELWVGRIGRWLRAGRLGDLGVGGDGWSNLVHVDDVCQAAMAALKLPLKAGELPIFNLSAPDSPRWNDYFVDMALALQFTPVRRIGRRQLQLDAWLAGPPLKLAQKAFRQAQFLPSSLPAPLSPGLLRLWAQHIQLDAQQASQKLEMAWIPYAAGLKSSAGWLAENEIRTPGVGKTACIH